MTPDATYNRLCTEALDRALRFVPAYESWQDRDPGTAAPVDARFAALPRLTKQGIRLHTARGFVPAGLDLETAFRNEVVEFVSTSGTTDEKVVNIWNQRWWDASEAASWKLNSHAASARLGRHREAILTSPFCTGVPSDNGPVAYADRRLGRFLYLNEYWDPSTWTDGHYRRMVDELNRFRPRVLEANPSMLALLARFITVSGIHVFQPELIVLTYEFPSRIHYRLIRQAFSSPVASSYGTTEAGYVFMECEAGKLHQNTLSCRVDFQPLKPEHGGPHTGRIFVTTFHNEWYALVRFDVGDLVTLSEGNGCTCGRGGGFVADRMAGRVKNIILDTNGRGIVPDRIDRALAQEPAVLHYQLIQAAQNDYRIELYCDRDSTHDVSNAVTLRCRELLGGDARIEVAVTDTVPRPDPPGKYRLVKPLVFVDAERLFENHEISLKGSDA